MLEHGADISRAAGIHGTLERIIFPAKDVVAVLRIAVPANYSLDRTLPARFTRYRNLLVVGAPSEWLRTILGPYVLVIKGGGL